MASRKKSAFVSLRGVRTQPIQETKGQNAQVITYAEGADVAARYVLRSAIVLSKRQPRRYFDDDKQQRLVSSIKEKGILQPLVVRPVEDNRYELVAGERRYRAAQAIKLERVPVTIKSLTAGEAFEYALVENIEREDLTPLEKAEAMVELAAVRTKRPRQWLLKTINMAANPQRKSVQDVMHTSEWKILEETLAQFGYSVNGFRGSLLRALKMPEEVKNAHLQHNLDYNKAIDIARVKNGAQRKALLKAAVEEGLTVEEIRLRVKHLKVGTQGQSRENTSDFQGRFAKVYAQVRKTKLWNSVEAQQRLEQILAELEGLLEEGRGKAAKDKESLSAARSHKPPKRTATA